MRRQEASRVVAVPLREVETQLRDVESWTTFLKGVDRISKLGHERYMFHIDDDGDTRDVTVAVRVDPRMHRIRWKSCEGPTFAGVLTLQRVDRGHTSVHLSLTSHPKSFFAGVGEMIMPRLARATVDVQALERSLLTSA